MMKNSSPDSSFFFEILTPSELSKSFSIDLESANRLIKEQRIKKNICHITQISCDSQKSEHSPIGKYHNNQEILINTGSHNLNEILGGGLYPNNVYLIYGEFATGKSQICHDLSFNLIKQYKFLNEEGNLLYIDTENTFRPERIIEIARFNDFNDLSILKNIKFLNIKSFDELKRLFKKISIEGLDPTIRLLIIDSFTIFIRTDFADSDKSYKTISQELIEVMKLLIKVKNTYKIPIVLTSQVRSVMSKSVKKRIDVKPVMEYILNEFVDEIIYLRKGENDSRQALLVNSTLLPEKEGSFFITKKGLQD